MIVFDFNLTWTIGRLRERAAVYREAAKRAPDRTDKRELRSLAKFYDALANDAESR